jgi:hypothetical protein
VEKQQKNKTIRWFILYAFTGIIDLVQIIIDFTGVGILVSEILEFVTGPILLGLFILFRIPIFTKPRRVASILGVFVGDAVTGGFAPFWILDVLYVHWDVKRESFGSDSVVGKMSNISKPISLNHNGVRLPSRQPPPLNSGGMRMPNGGLKPI